MSSIPTRGWPDAGRSPPCLDYALTVVGVVTAVLAGLRPSSARNWWPVVDPKAGAGSA